MIQRMYLHENFSFATSFAFILLIPFLVYYSLKTFMSPDSGVKEVPSHYDYRLPEFLISSHVDKSKYLRRRMKLKEQTKRREQQKAKQQKKLNSLSNSANQRFLGRCSIALKEYEQINQHASKNCFTGSPLLYKAPDMKRYGKKNSKKKSNYGFQPTQLTIIHEDAEY